MQRIPPKPIPAVKALIQFQGKVLIVREATTYKTGTQIGNYDVPGGQMQGGQTVKENLLREIQEETGLTVKIGCIFSVNESHPIIAGEERYIVRMFFTCVAQTSKVILSQDHDDAIWIDPKEFRDYNIIPNLIPVFEAYLQINKK